jgi:hypothetical protein
MPRVKELKHSRQIPLPLAPERRVVFSSSKRIIGDEYLRMLVREYGE